MKVYQLAIVAALCSGAEAIKRRLNGPSPPGQDKEKNANHKKGHESNPGKIITGDDDDKGRIKNKYMVTHMSSLEGGRLQNDVVVVDVVDKATFQEEIEAVCADTQKFKLVEGIDGVGDYSFVGNPHAIAACCEDMDDIGFCEEDHTVDLDETFSSEEYWGLDEVTSGPDFFMWEPEYEQYAGEMAYSGQGVQVYLIDSGIDGTHEQFQGRVGTGKDIIQDTETDANVDNDSCDHGTHTAGTCCGEDTGIAPGVTIHPVKAFNCGGSRSNIRSALHWCRRHHIDNFSINGSPAIGVVNMSFSGGTSQSINNLVNRLYNEANLVPVASAGNNNGKDACNKSPAGADAAITVAASTAAGEFWSGSNIGSCVDIIAPGIGIRSAMPGGEYDEKSGTSMSAPHVTGALALVVDEKHSGVGNSNENTGKGSIFQRVRNKADLDVLGNVPPGTVNRFLNIDYHKSWVDNNLD